MSDISAEIVSRFLLHEGTIGVVDPAGVMRMLHPWLTEYLDLAQTANRLWHNRVWHSREAFLQLCAASAVESPLPPSFESSDLEAASATRAALAV
jgi:hypothetical protein